MKPRPQIVESARLSLAPTTLDEANLFVELHHRHAVPTEGHKFSLVAARDGEVVGVAIVGRPVARGLDNGWTLEALRVCTDGTRNACSFLYGAAWRATRALGYRKLVTYTLKSESGASLRAAGYTIVAEVKGRQWDAPSRPRVHRQDTLDKWRWEAAAA